jgi:hypothetical protein
MPDWRSAPPATGIESNMRPLSRARVKYNDSGERAARAAPLFAALDHRRGFTAPEAGAAHAEDPMMALS